MICDLLMILLIYCWFLIVFSHLKNIFQLQGGAEKPHTLKSKVWRGREGTFSKTGSC